MFALVNRAVKAASGDWACFLRKYAAYSDNFRATPLGQQVEVLLGRKLEPLLPELSKVQGALTIVDSGMQGTFALAIATWLSERLDEPKHRVDVLGTHQPFSFQSEPSSAWAA